jgi:hypothetical protein
MRGGRRASRSRAGDTFVTEARSDPALMQVVPDVVPPGGELEAVFPSGADRGPGFVLERHGEEGWAWRFAISSGHLLDGRDITAWRPAGAGSRGRPATTPMVRHPAT